MKLATVVNSRSRKKEHVLALSAQLKVILNTHLELECWSPCWQIKMVGTRYVFSLVFYLNPPNNSNRYMCYNWLCMGKISWFKRKQNEENQKWTKFFIHYKYLWLSDVGWVARSSNLTYVWLKCHSSSLGGQSGPGKRIVTFIWKKWLMSLEWNTV